MKSAERSGRWLTRFQNDSAAFGISLRLLEHPVCGLCAGGRGVGLCSLARADGGGPRVCVADAEALLDQERVSFARGLPLPLNPQGRRQMTPADRKQYQGE